MKSNKEVFNLEWQFKKYLERANVKEEDLPPIQLKEMKQAFMGACGQMLVLFKNDITDIPDEDDAVETMEDLFKQVMDYFEQAVKDYEKNR